MPGTGSYAAEIAVFAEAVGFQVHALIDLLGMGAQIAAGYLENGRDRGFLRADLDAAATAEALLGLIAGGTVFSLRDGGEREQTGALRAGGDRVDVRRNSAAQRRIDSMKATKIDLTDSVVAITGAGRGIGRATAELFAQRGATVYLGDLDAESASDVASAIGPRAHAFVLDVTDRASFAAFVASVEEAAGPIDVLVNNAGIMPEGRFLDESDETTAKIFDVNVWGPINGMRLVLSGMTSRRRGHVVNVASMLGKTELPGLASYTASKYALVGLTAAVRPELEGSGVTLPTILPSVVNTDLSSGIAIPLARLVRVEPEDVARAIVASCGRRPKELAVPRWIGLYPVLRPFIPDRVDALARRLIGDDRALTAVDNDRRADYADRIANQTTRGR